MTSRVLVLDDDQDQCEVLALMLRRLGHEVASTTSPQHALDLMHEQDFDAVLTDFGMSEMSGPDVCERMLGVRPDIPVIFVTGFADMESALAAMRRGAHDFLTKPVDPQLLDLSIKRAIQHHKLQSELKSLRSETVDRASLDALVGVSSPMKRVKESILRLAHSDASVLVQGETGTGKELVAHAIHKLSPRRDKPFVAINCAAVAPTLLESELFGHARGAFTDASSARSGLFVEANGGTLFLDEIGELPLELQPKLLRALQERTVRPVGSNKEVPIDVRLVTATHRNLELEARERRFREDLYYRVNVVHIDMPPLRERGPDILTLAAHFLAKASGPNRAKRTLSSAVTERLLSYDWPGNVRELENCMQRAIALSAHEQVLLEDLPDKIRTFQAEQIALSTKEAAEIISIDELERRYILRAITLLNGNRSRAAAALGLDRRTLYRKLGAYEKKSARTAAPSERSAVH